MSVGERTRGGTRPRVLLRRTVVAAVGLRVRALDLRLELRLERVVDVVRHQGEAPRPAAVAGVRNSGRNPEQHCALACGFLCPGALRHVADSSRVDYRYG